jgi:hypothetical protein
VKEGGHRKNSFSMECEKKGWGSAKVLKEIKNIRTTS